MKKQILRILVYMLVVIILSILLAKCLSEKANDPDLWDDSLITTVVTETEVPIILEEPIE